MNASETDNPPGYGGSEEEMTPDIRLKHENTLYAMAMNIFAEKSVRDKAKIAKLQEELERTTDELGKTIGDNNALKYIIRDLKGEISANQPTGIYDFQAQELAVLKKEHREFKAAVFMDLYGQLAAAKHQNARKEEQNVELRKEVDELERDVRGLQLNVQELTELRYQQASEKPAASHVHRLNLQVEIMRKTIHNLEADNKRLQRAGLARSKYAPVPEENAA
ncbi:hypothetical protein Dda_3706 [Drechslerella dactyloides]|uniref:Uncharacterized protein n=1 Tax=Drechslerella dactyloides TaxID=74499 RepID=A0AAD6NIR9_DREDA|nr:hypothetical protein Dda_3706 [Drechslerella dactyloides]